MGVTAETEAIHLEVRPSAGLSGAAPANPHVVPASRRRPGVIGLRGLPGAPRQRLRSPPSFTAFGRFVVGVAALLVLVHATGARADTPADGSNAALEGFSTRLRSAPEGDRPVRVLWYGDSAIVSDGYTRVVRRALQERFGDGGPGFVLAAEAFDGYLRDGVRMKRSGWRHGNVIQDEVRNGRYGLGGIVAAGSKGASLTLEPKSGSVRGVDVFVQRGPKAGTVGVFVDGAREPVATFDASADALADEVWRVRFDAAVKEQVRVKVMSGTVRVYGASLETGRGVQLDALGILGVRARRWLNADAAHMKGQVAARNPDLLVINFGGNERVDPGLTEDRHADDISATLALLRAGAPSASCLVVGPLLHGTEVRGAMVVDPQLDILYAAQRRAATAAGCAFLDTIALMGGADRSTLKTWRKKRWLSGDYAHLTSAGHEELGRRMADWLLSRVASPGDAAAQ